MSAVADPQDYRLMPAGSIDTLGTDAKTLPW